MGAERGTETPSPKPGFSLGASDIRCQGPLCHRAVLSSSIPGPHPVNASGDPSRDNETLPASPNAGDKVAPYEVHCSEERGEEVGASWEVRLTHPLISGGKGGEPFQGGARQSWGDGDGGGGKAGPNTGTGGRL